MLRPGRMLGFLSRQAFQAASPFFNNGTCSSSPRKQPPKSWERNSYGSDVLDAKLLVRRAKSSLNFASAGLTILSSNTSISRSTEG